MLSLILNTWVIVFINSPQLSFKSEIKIVNVNLTKLLWRLNKLQKMSCLIVVYMPY